MPNSKPSICMSQQLGSEVEWQGKANKSTTPRTPLFKACTARVTVLCLCVCPRLFCRGTLWTIPTASELKKLERVFFLTQYFQEILRENKQKKPISIISTDLPRLGREVTLRMCVWSSDALNTASLCSNVTVTTQHGQAPQLARCLH